MSDLVRYIGSLLEIDERYKRKTSVCPDCEGWIDFDDHRVELRCEEHSRIKFHTVACIDHQSVLELMGMLPSCLCKVDK